MKLDKEITAIALTRQDDLASARRKRHYDAKRFLEDYSEEIRSKIATYSEARLQEAFFVLGRASMAIFLACRHLSEIPQTLMGVGEIRSKMTKERKLRIGIFEPYCFPAVEIKMIGNGGFSKKESKVIPALIFIRTPLEIEALVRKIQSMKPIGEHVQGLYLGLGMYDVILRLGFRSLHEFGDVYGALRASLGKFWETSTIIGVPMESSGLQKEREQAKSTRMIPFSTSAKCIGGKDAEVAKGMYNL